MSGEWRKFDLSDSTNKLRFYIWNVWDALSIINPTDPWPVSDPCLLPSRPVRRLWCWRWATAGWTWCRLCWHRGRRSICRTTRAPRRWCVPASTAMPTSLDSCWHSQTATPPWLIVYVSHYCHCAAPINVNHSIFVSHITKAEWTRIPIQYVREIKAQKFYFSVCKCSINFHNVFEFVCFTGWKHSPVYCSGGRT